MRVFLAAAVLALINQTPGAAQTSPAPPVVSATQARDIGGFRLGMTVDEVRSRMPLEHVAFETFSGTYDGVQFELGFTPQGHLFRIQAQQNIGRFQPDAQFARNLSTRLISKYGSPVRNSLPGGTADWELIQSVRNADGRQVPFRTMWFSVMLNGDSEGVTLDMTMLDFRVLWADQQELNRGPSQQATDTVRF